MIKRFRKGKLLNTRAEVLAKMDANEWVFLMNKDTGRGRPLHPQFLRRFSLEKIDTLVNDGLFFEAIEKRKSEHTTGIHRSPAAHQPDWLLTGNKYVCQYPGCPQTQEV